MDKCHNWNISSMWCKDVPNKMYMGQWRTFHGPVIFFFYLEDYWWMDIRLLWHIHWPETTYVGQWPIFNGHVILPFIIYKLMKYRKTLIKYFKKCYFHWWKISTVISLVKNINFLMTFAFSIHFLVAPLTHLRCFSFFVCEEKHQVWVCIFSVRMKGITWY